jgi:predicted TIM-barrel fold metal-dependent hydrolase
MAGVFDRFPGLRLVLAEQGTGWIGDALDVMDNFAAHIARGNIGELRFLEPQTLEKSPTEYWQTNCAVAASFLHREDCERRARVGSDHIMWGSDYPHLEGTSPFSREAIRLTFAGVPEPEVRAMLGGTAAAIYGFDLAKLDEIAARVGPPVDEVATGLDVVPDGAQSLAFRDHAPANV